MVQFTRLKGRIGMDKGKPDCELCEGKGFYLLSNGPDDWDKKVCHCVEEEDDD